MWIQLITESEMSYVSSKVLTGVLLAVLSSYSVNAIPTLVELERRQYDNFLRYIGNISIDIEGENITLNANFHSLILLQEQSIQLQEQTIRAIEHLGEDFNTLFNNAFSMIGEGLVNINETNIAILNAVKSSDQSNQELLGQLITSIATLDTHQEERKDSWYNKFETIMNPLSQTLADVNNAINIVHETVDAIYGIFEVFQESQDVFVEDIAGDTAAMAAEMSAMSGEVTAMSGEMTAITADVSAIAANFILGMRGVIARATVGSKMVCAETALDDCAYDPLGTGPIGCIGAELNACDLLPLPRESCPDDSDQTPSKTVEQN